MVHTRQNSSSLFYSVSYLFNCIVYLFIFFAIVIVLFKIFCPLAAVGHKFLRLWIIKGLLIVILALGVNSKCCC